MLETTYGSPSSFESDQSTGTVNIKDGQYVVLLDLLSLWYFPYEL